MSILDTYQYGNEVKEFIKNNKDLIIQDKWVDFFTKLGKELSLDDSELLRMPVLLIEFFDECGVDCRSSLEDYIYIYDGGTHPPMWVHHVKVTPGVEVLPDNRFYIRRYLESIDIPDSVKEIGKDCFYGCKSLKSINIPNSVSYIGKRCFDDCRSLESITIPNSVRRLEGYCFFGCESLKSVNIPKSVEEIGERCFANCKSLKSINIPESVRRIEDYCFGDGNNITIYCKQGSYADKYAKKHGINVRYI